MVSIIDSEDISESKKFVEYCPLRNNLILVPGYSLEGGIEPTSESRSSHPDGRWRLALTSGCGQVQHK